MELFGQLPPVTVRAWVGKDETGRLLGAAGYYVVNGRAVMWSDLKEGAPKSAIWRAAKQLMREVEIPLICVVTPGSEKFLERLGWRHEGTSVEGEVYAWHN